MDFELALVRSGEVPSEQFVEALHQQKEERLPLGQIALETGLLTVRQVREILQAQEDTPQRFGNIAMSMGFLDRRGLAELLMVQNERQRPIVEHLVDLGAMTREQARAAVVAFRAGARLAANLAEKAAPPRELRPPHSGFAQRMGARSGTPRVSDAVLI